MTLAEILLWNRLKDKQLLGYDFHRQKPIDEFVMDFFCPKLLLAIDIDGDSHEWKLERDSQRQRDIEKFGVRFLRRSDEEVKTNLEDVVDAIANWNGHRHSGRVLEILKFRQCLCRLKSEKETDLERQNNLHTAQIPVASRFA